VTAPAQGNGAVTDELPFRIAVLTLAILIKLVRWPSRRRVGWRASWPGMRRNPLDTAILFGMAIAWGVALVTYVFFPATVSPAALGLPAWLRWLGVGIAVVGLAMIGWADRALGGNLSVTLRIRDGHTLVTTGPYRRARHPIYTGGLLYAAAHPLIAANGFVGACFLAPYVLLLLTRIPKEERMMLEAFGDEYRRYMQRTGRLLPKMTHHGGTEDTEPRGATTDEHR